MVSDIRMRAAANYQKRISVIMQTLSPVDLGYFCCFLQISQIFAEYYSVVSELIWEKECLFLYARTY